MNAKTAAATAALLGAAVGSTYVGLDESHDAYVLTAVDAGSECVVPDCRGWGGWDERHAPVDCLGIGVMGEADGGPRWNGCVSQPRAYMTGGQCLPSACVLPAGVDPLKKM